MNATDPTERTERIRLSLGVMGARIAEARRRYRGLSAKQFAERLEVSPASVKRLEDGSDGISTGLLAKACYELDCLPRVAGILPAASQPFPRSLDRRYDTAAERVLADLGHRVFARRTVHGQSRAVFARLADVSVNGLARLERGDPGIRLRILAGVCDQWERLDGLERLCMLPVAAPPELRRASGGAA